MRSSMLVFGRPAIGEEEIQSVAEVMRSGWIGTGPKAAEFESVFKKYIGTDHAIALNSCTAALHLSLLALGIKAGHEVITTPLTFCATANAIIHTGAKPVFVDVERETMNINPALIEKAITPRTMAIIPVHLAGRPCNMEEIMRIAKKHGLFVIEDAAHCIEGWYKGQKIGAIGDIGCFSFYVTKNITTSEGGMVTTNDPWIADRIKISALHGMSRDAWKRYSDIGFKQYQVVTPGFKYNMTDIQAAIGLEQMKKIKHFHEIRRDIWTHYNRQFSHIDKMTLPIAYHPNHTHAYHLYTILVENRDEVQRKLQEKNIGTGIHFVSLHQHEYYKKTYGYKPEDFPEARHISDRTLSLPLSPALSDEDVNDVVKAVKEVVAK